MSKRIQAALRTAVALQLTVGLGGCLDVASDAELDRKLAAAKDAASDETLLGDTTAGDSAAEDTAVTDVAADVAAQSDTASTDAAASDVAVVDASTDDAVADDTLADDTLADDSAGSDIGGDSTTSDGTASDDAAPADATVVDAAETDAESDSIEASDAAEDSQAGGDATTGTDAAAIVCNQGETACQDGQVATCNEQGTGWTYKSCDDGLACTVESCASGACQKTSTLLWDQSLPPPGGVTGQFTDVGLLGDGSYLAAGSRGTTALPWLVRLDSAGNVIWSDEASAGAASPARVLATPDGGWVASAPGVLRKWSADGQPGWTAATATGTGASALLGLEDNSVIVAGAGAGSYVCVSCSGNNVCGDLQTLAPKLVKVGSDGKVVWTKTLSALLPTGTSPGVRIADVLALPNGQLLVVATRWSAYACGNLTGYSTSLFVADGDGSQVQVVHNVVQWPTHRAVQLASGDLLLAGPGGKVSRVTQQGTVVWSHPVLWPGVESVNAAALPSGGALVAGGNQGTGWLARVADDGNVLWRTSEPSTGSWYGIHATTTAAVLVGQRNDKSAWLRRMDPWGNASCEASGACYGGMPNACNDGDPCTWDLCAAGSCSKPATPDGVPCAAGMACAVGVCL